MTFVAVSQWPPALVEGEKTDSYIYGLFIEDCVLARLPENIWAWTYVSGVRIVVTQAPSVILN